jgi:hypothetical protein
VKYEALPQSILGGPPLSRRKPEEKMKKIYLLPLVLVIFAFLFGCAGGPQGAGPGKPKYETLDHKGNLYGEPLPDWVMKSPIDLEEDEEYEDKYVFKIESDPGKSLEGLKAWTQGFSAPTEIARFVSTRVKNKFVGAQVGDKDMVETYFENVTKTLSETRYAGARKQDDWWVLRQMGNDQNYFYIMLITIDRDTLDEMIARAIDEEYAQNKPKTEEEQTARDRVKELFAEEGLSGASDE